MHGEITFRSYWCGNTKFKYFSSVLFRVAGDQRFFFFYKKVLIGVTETSLGSLYYVANSFHLLDENFLASDSLLL
jgi:hypothetical protein